ncbi:MAG TPA: TlyA family RNA methyltransferase [Myxococcota bacterium]|nr:TlyA family RNA methyltransferase [Myxococcota bacterium]
MGRQEKIRLDQLLYELGLCESRSRAKALVMAGRVTVGDMRIDKPGTTVARDAEVRLKEPDHPYVSRGGVKLAGALADLGLDVSGMTVLDVGASTGGFTDCLLQHGAAKIYALDVGRGQLHNKLVRDERVTRIEGLNVRKLRPEDLPESVDLVTFDLSFISLRLALPPVLPHLKPGGRLLAMVKPQFEVGHGKVGKGGIVRDEALRREAVEGIVRFAKNLGLEIEAEVPSRLPGADGNREVFLLLAFSS